MKKLLTVNIELKAITLILALLLWFFVTLKGQSEIILELPLEYKNIPKGFELVKSSTNFVNISVKGQERLIKNIGPKDVSVYVDLTNARDGETIVNLNKENVRVPSSVTVNKLTPAHIIIQLEETIMKVVQVRPVIKGQPQKGFEVTDTIVSPEEITIEGYKRDLKSVGFLETQPINIRNANATVERYVSLVRKDKEIEHFKDRVKVKVIIEKVNQ
ncbi:YbbR-like protein [Candidatus Magnetobacterium bavaricum]|uniref:YbbR-like protein n=1 Tax=Candidatus Magnetobacterium bavaricum TaxID=29290 RepID=A0A0F3GIK5_9BACT|nr:YbbR-like protein [Candidatus Magnetobacterium bavaricum]